MTQQQDEFEISDSELLELDLDQLCGTHTEKPEPSDEDNDCKPGKSEPCCGNQERAALTSRKDVPQPINQSPEPGEARAPNSDCTVAKKQKQDKRTPMEKFGLTYLNVTHLSRQAWCEQQVVYGMEMPQIERLRAELPIVKAGTSLHLARELEVHDIVAVNVTSREDIWAIKLLNLLSMIQILQTGGIVREMPVFGELDGFFLVGIIDELRYNSKGELELCEFKTRSHRSLPGAAQRKSHHLQVRVYKRLFEVMIRGEVDKATLLRHLRLRSEEAFGSEVVEHAEKAGFTVHAFGDLLDLVLLNLNYSEIPKIDALMIEYCYQADSSIIGAEAVCFQEEWVQRELANYFSFWSGQRAAEGVDIEEAWKCRSCDFADICNWRQRKAEEFTRKNKAKHSRGGLELH